MKSNLVSIQMSPEKLAQAEQALASLEDALGALISLDGTNRRRLRKMGQKSEVFCRQTLSLMTQNPKVVPESMDLPEAIADLQALDQLRPLLDRLERLAERGADTEMALGSDLMDSALEGYALLKYTGRGQGLESLRKEIGSRWARPKRVAAEVEEDPA